MYQVLGVKLKPISWENGEKNAGIFMVTFFSWHRVNQILFLNVVNVITETYLIQSLLHWFDHLLSLKRGK